MVLSSRAYSLSASSANGLNTFSHTPVSAQRLKAGVNGFPRAKPLRQIPPRYPGPVTVQHGFDKQAIVFGGDANRLFSSGQQRLNPFPLIVS
jgi:hypothetical protein